MIKLTCEIYKKKNKRLSRGKRKKKYQTKQNLLKINNRILFATKKKLWWKAKENNKFEEKDNFGELFF